MLLKRSVLAGVFVLATSIAANATDVVVPMVPPPPPPPPPAPVFSWAGPYVGAYGGYAFGPNVFQIGLQAGYNFTSGGFLAGIEAQAGAIVGGGVGFEGELNARLGAILGESFLVYAEAGVGILYPIAWVWTVGGGAEIAVGPSISLFAEGKLLRGFGGGTGVIAQGGINWHPTY